jgi:secreted trypsin-like serine protease
LALPPSRIHQASEPPAVLDLTAARFSNNNGTVHQGGTCFGDSGGPTFYDRTNIVVTVTSFGISPNCTGSDDEYRIDQPDDLAFLAGFGVTP